MTGAGPAMLALGRARLPANGSAAGTGALPDYDGGLASLCPTASGKVGGMIRIIHQLMWCSGTWLIVCMALDGTFSDALALARYARKRAIATLGRFLRVIGRCRPARVKKVDGDSLEPFCRG